MSIQKTTNQSALGVLHFHQAFGHTISEKPMPISKPVALKRAIWTAEELIEFLHASVGGDETQFKALLGSFMSGIDTAVKKQIDAGPIEKEDILTAQMDALTDISYFNYGSFVSAGVDPQPLFDIVQSANMAKLGADGKPIIRESDGKIMKPEGWESPEPKLEKEIQNQIDNA
jgi:predicted HAD superfamily Cof-like phosphohydrolase